jgi:GTPase SAR1 family protein
MAKQASSHVSFVSRERPKLVLPKLLCDEKLHDRLDKYEITSLMNRSFACAVLGKAGTGKTSLVSGLLETKSLMNKVFDKIILFMPPNSRKSLKDSIFDCIPKNQVFDRLCLESLNTAFTMAEGMSKYDKNTLIIFDDVQQFFKGECEDLLVHMLNNRRHNRLSMFFVAQSYKKLPRLCRMGLSDLFMFRLSKDDMKDVFDEVIDFEEETWEKIVAIYKKQLKESGEKKFLYVNTISQRVFCDWDELTFTEDIETDITAKKDVDAPVNKKRKT